MRPVELRELMLITIEVRPVTDLGGGRRYVSFASGTFEGRDGLVGTVLDGGIDWQTVRPDGVLEIDAHYTLQTDAGEAVEVRSQGVRKASESVAARLARGMSSIPTSTTSGRSSDSRPRRRAWRGATTSSPSRPASASAAPSASTCTRSCE